MNMLAADELRQYSYFSGLSEGALAELAGRLASVEVGPGTCIIRQGTPSDYFYFIRKGELEVSKRNSFGQVAKLTVLNGGQGFGETAMLTCAHRTSSVTALTDCSLLRLGKSDFEEVVLMDSAFTGKLLRGTTEHSTYNRMKSYRPFALLEPEKMPALAEKMTEVTCAPGQDIVRQGDPPGPYYIVKQGRVAVLKVKPGETQVQVAELGEGEGFGEEAIIRDQGRSATVRALTDTVVLVLDKRDFNKLLKASYLENTFPEDVPAEERTRYVYIDARVPPEYEEEHIEGALNIPIEVLRSKYQGLDPEQEYITYCTNDSRGMAAAFLLSQNGFRAKCLRGGLSGWTGPTSTCQGGIHMPATKAATH